MFKVPITTFNKTETGWGGLMITAGLCASSAYGAYKSLQQYKVKKPKAENAKL
jgi:hypothetical protein